MLFLGAVLLAGCAGGPAGYYSGGYPGGTQLGTSPAASSAERVAILLPLTGPRADIGDAMLKAAQLALSPPGSPRLTSYDTRGTPEGASDAARTAIAQGAGLILGPLTAPETAAVAPIGRSAGVAVLAFTNDPAQAQPGTWTLGITPTQQVRRLAAAAVGQDRNRFAALLPANNLGNIMAEALRQAAAAEGAPPPEIRLHQPGMPAITAAVRDLSGYAQRRGPLDARIKAARALNTPESRQEAHDLAKAPIPPAPFNALLLADTGDELAAVAAMLPYYDVDRSAVRIMGPSSWASSASGSGQMPGAWFAAPDPAARTTLEQDYTNRHGQAPPAVADLAFDAASIARVLAARRDGFSIRALTQPSGFEGADGWLALQPDGNVRRGLGVFRIDRGGPSMIEPAPDPASGHGS